MFTGAGISTSAGIPDFRGPEGAWTLAATGGKRTKPTTSTIKAIPTPSHMSLVGLFNSGYAKFLISQNTDGLHRKSGVLPHQVCNIQNIKVIWNQIAELHGNSNLEICRKCGKHYMRDFNVSGHILGLDNHMTGRRCAKSGCGGYLCTYIISTQRVFISLTPFLQHKHIYDMPYWLIIQSIGDFVERKSIAYSELSNVYHLHIMNSSFLIFPRRFHHQLWRKFTRETSYRRLRKCGESWSLSCTRLEFNCRSSCGHAQNCCPSWKISDMQSPENSVRFRRCSENLFQDRCVYEESDELSGIDYSWMEIAKKIIGNQHLSGNNFSTTLAFLRDIILGIRLCCKQKT